MNSALDRAHAASERLTAHSTHQEVLAVVELYRQAAWPDRLLLSPGTIAWFIADFLPRWLEAQQ